MVPGYVPFVLPLYYIPAQAVAGMGVLLQCPLEFTLALAGLWFPLLLPISSSSDTVWYEAFLWALSELQFSSEGCYAGCSGRSPNFSWVLSYPGPEDLHFEFFRVFAFCEAVGQVTHTVPGFLF